MTAPGGDDASVAGEFPVDRASMTTPWWRDAVIYQVYLPSFADGDGDGFGDIEGLRSRLPYLRELGVDALWITPWYRSPMVDGGYDVADFRAIDPRFGTLSEAEQLIGDAHALGLRVIPDIVPNHTSDQHAWFQAALRAGPGSPERDRYIFRPGRGRDGELPPNNWPSRFGGPAWQRVTEPDGSPGEWYLHLYAPEQPDVNWANPEVRAEFRDILRFWFDRGIDGFRIDVAHGNIKQQGLPDIMPGADEATDGSHPYRDHEGLQELFAEWRQVADEYDGDRTFVAELWLPSTERMARHLRPGLLHTAFNFNFLRTAWEPTALRAVIDDTMTSLDAVGAPATWVLSNHDVTRHVSRFGRPPKGWGNGAHYVIEGPLDGELGRRRARAAAMLTLALPGGCYVYQGDELGLAEVEDLPEAALRDPVWTNSGHTRRGRDGCRVPLPWSGDRSPYGFSAAGAESPWLPQPACWAGHTVADQDGDPASHLELYRTGLRIRRSHPALGDGSMTWNESAPGVLDFSRARGFRCILNFADDDVPLPPTGEVLLSSVTLTGRFLPPDSAVWLTS
ncbi:glycoside hydrolase family 13 protein [Micropruina sp.]|uniref:glycoside hydrolase family 13 protein n=1 Tax=Micropruina sp. TaxID=2737536 RepID=UPI0039E50CC5